MRYKITIATMVLALSLSSCKGEKLPDKPEDLYGNYYEIFVASFYDSDGDGMGDLNGINEKMTYLNDGNNKAFDDLMVDGLWLMPIMPSPSYHKYDVTDYKAVAPQYGTMDDFEKLMATTEKASVKVIIDLVLNHSSKEHPWFLEAVDSLKNGKDSPYIDYYHFIDEPGIANYHAVPGLSGYYYEGTFGDHMPDLNLDNEALRAEILDIAQFWLDKGVDGFRLDAVIHFYDGNNTKNNAFLSWFSKEIKTLNPNAYIVCEAWSDGGTILNLYESGVMSFFNFPFSGPKGEIVTNLRSKQGNDLSEAIERWQKEIKAINSEAIDAPFLSNHDNARSGGTLNRDLSLQKMGANIYMLMPGNAFIYYGEEIGMMGSGRDENKRQPMVWSLTDQVGMTNPPANSETVKLPEAGVELQLEDSESLLNHYKTLLKIKRLYPEIARGDVTAIAMDHYMICAYETVWEHDDQSDRVVIIHNLSDEVYTLNIDDFSATEVAAMLTTDGSELNLDGNTLSMPAKSSVILK